jgi:biopolymer transport protein ExbD
MMNAVRSSMLIVALTACAGSAGSPPPRHPPPTAREVAAELVADPEFVRAVAQAMATLVTAAAVPVDLPRSASGEDITTTLALTLTRDGSLYLDGRRVTEDEVRAAIASARGGNREIRAVLAADREVPHSRVVQIIDFVRAQGVTRFAINVEPP